MRFDVAKARAEMETEAAGIVAPALVPFVAKVAIVATPPARKVEPSARPSAPTVYPYGISPGGHPRTWTGRIVSPTEWQCLSDWDRDGSTGQAWNGLTRRWELFQNDNGENHEGTA